jgi:hypothetical protein
MLFTKPLLLVAAVATASPLATRAEDDPHGLNLTPAEKELMKDLSAWNFTSVVVNELEARQDPEARQDLETRQMHIRERHVYQWGVDGLFNCPVLVGIDRKIIALLTMFTTDGSNNGANTATWSSHLNADEFSPRTVQPFDLSTESIRTTATHRFCGTLLGSSPPIHCAIEMTVPLTAIFDRTPLPRRVTAEAPTMKEACARLDGRGICPPNGFVQRDCTVRSWDIVSD